MRGGQGWTRQDGQMGLPSVPSLPLICYLVYGPVTVLSSPAGGGRAVKEAPGSLRTALGMSGRTAAAQRCASVMNVSLDPAPSPATSSVLSARLPPGVGGSSWLVTPPPSPHPGHLGDGGKGRQRRGGGQLVPSAPPFPLLQPDSPKLRAADPTHPPSPLVPHH